MTRRALGRGLSALLGESEQPRAGDELVEVDIDRIDPGKHQPRKNFKEEMLNELASSIRSTGILQPIILRRKGQRYELIAGERRWRAAQRAGLLKVPAVVRDIPDENVLALALIENIQRQELNAIEEARAYQKLTDDLGLTQEEVSQKVGKERATVANTLRLLRLSDEIQKMVEDEALSMGHARALLALETAAAQKKLAREIVAKRLSVREVERIIARGEHPHFPSAKRSIIKLDPNTRAAVEKLERKLGTRVRVVRTKKGGRIEIDYYSEADLDRIYSVIMRRGES